MKYQSFAILIFTIQVHAATNKFPLGPVEHVGKEPSDIVHCLHEDEHNRQFCKVGWGPAFQKVERLYGKAPRAYATQLLIPDVRQTPYGALTAKYVIDRLKGPLWTKWQIEPELLFLLDWSQHPNCWKNGLLATQIKVISSDKTIGLIRPQSSTNPEESDVHIPLTTPQDLPLWSVIDPSSELSDHVNWTQPNSVAIFTEFDFVQGSIAAYPFSVQVLPSVCQIKITNTQTVLNREAVTNALRVMESEALRIQETLMAWALAYAIKIQGSDAVKCLISSQLSSLKTAAGLSESASTNQLPPEARDTLMQNLVNTSALTGINVSEDPVEFLNLHRREWEKACEGTTSFDSIADAAASSPTSDFELKSISTKYVQAKSELNDLLGDAWSLSVLLEVINNDNRRLQWMIDATINYKLKGN